jgi:hypothetical protein
MSYIEQSCLNISETKFVGSARYSAIHSLLQNDVITLCCNEAYDSLCMVLIYLFIYLFTVISFPNNGFERRQCPSLGKELCNGVISEIRIDSFLYFYVPDT